jgi:D-inositol-3-phosphate glycosyltransferase
VDDGRSGLLVQGHDPVVWAKVLGGLLDDPARRDAMARSAVRHARRFSWEATVDALLAVYAAAVGDHRRDGEPALDLAEVGPQPLVAAR